MSNYRIFVEKHPEFQVEAKSVARSSRRLQKKVS